jgi:hypothetical protein
MEEITDRRNLNRVLKRLETGGIFVFSGSEF